MMTDVEQIASVELRRWNFEADDEGLLVCKGEHDKGERCEAHMERLSPHEALKIINELRAECLQWEAKTMADDITNPEQSRAAADRSNESRGMCARAPGEHADVDFRLERVDPFSDTLEGRRQLDALAFYFLFPEKQLTLTGDGHFDVREQLIEFVKENLDTNIVMM